MKFNLRLTVIYERSVEAEYQPDAVMKGSDLLKGVNILEPDGWHLSERGLAAEKADLFLEALREIERGEGAFSADQLTHAINTVDNMKRIAREAIESVR